MATTLAKGLALPASRRTGGGYFARKSGVDKAWGDLLVALGTPIGSRPMRRGFGSAVHTAVFSPQGGQDDPALLFMVRDAAGKWCPQIALGAVRTAPKDNKVFVRVSFGLPGGAGGQGVFALPG